MGSDGGDLACSDAYLHEPATLTSLLLFTALQRVS